jgi:hypothetical protein
MLLSKWQGFPIVARKAQSQSIKDFIKLHGNHMEGGDDKKEELSNPGATEIEY